MIIKWRRKEKLDGWLTPRIGSDRGTQMEYGLLISHLVFLAHFSKQK